MTQRQCDVDDCDRSHVAKGLCSLHYQRSKRKGSLDAWYSITEYIENNTSDYDGNGCLLWTGSSNGAYGKGTYKYEEFLAHRKVYEVYIGEVPDGIFVCHSCDIPLCVNPKHLFLGTPLDNMRDMIAKGRGRFLNGVERGANVLDEHDVRMVRSLRKQGHTYQALSDQFGVGTTAIRDICDGRTWKWLN